MNALLQLLDHPDARLHIATWAGPGKWRCRCGYFGELAWPTVNDPLPSWVDAEAVAPLATLVEHSFSGPPTGRVMVLHWADEVTAGKVCRRCTANWRRSTDGMALLLAQLGAFEPTPRS